MIQLEERILRRMVELSADRVLLQNEKPILFLKEGQSVYSSRLIQSEQIFDFIQPLLSAQELRNWHEHRNVKIHHFYRQQPYTISMVSLSGIASAVIQKGKFDLYPNTDIIIPEIRIGTRFGELTPDAYISWIVVGFVSPETIRFLKNTGEEFHEYDLSLGEFLERLRVGKIYRETE